MLQIRTHTLCTPLTAWGPRLAMSLCSVCPDSRGQYSSPSFTQFMCYPPGKPLPSLMLMPDEIYVFTPASPSASLIPGNTPGSPYLPSPSPSFLWLEFPRGLGTVSERVKGLHSTPVFSPETAVGPEDKAQICSSLVGQHGT